MSAEAHPHPSAEHPEPARTEAVAPRPVPQTHHKPPKSRGEKAHDPAKAPAAARDKSPIGAAFSKAQMEADNAGNSVISGTTKFGELVRKALRADVEPVKQTGL